MLENKKISKEVIIHEIRKKVVYIAVSRMNEKNDSKMHLT